MENKLPFEKRKYEVLVRREVETNKEHGKLPMARGIDELLKSSVINLNKPAGPTSHQVSDYVKKILQVDKAGHSGTLEN